MGVLHTTAIQSLSCRLICALFWLILMVVMQKAVSHHFVSVCGLSFYIFTTFLKHFFLLNCYIFTCSLFFSILLKFQFWYHNYFCIVHTFENCMKMWKWMGKNWKSYLLLMRGKPPNQLVLLMLKWAQMKQTSWLLFLNLFTVYIVFESLCENIHWKLDAAVTVLYIIIVIIITIHLKYRTTIMKFSNGKITQSIFNEGSSIFSNCVFIFANLILFTHLNLPWKS